MAMTVLGVLLLASVSTATAQSAQISTLTNGYSYLDSEWRFHPGDDPSWASRGFDDSQWSLVRLDRSWADQGYRGFSGLGWYRLRITLPPGRGDLALLLESPASAAEIYADGKLIGTIGHMRPHPVLRGVDPVPQIIVLPSASSGHSLDLAMRVWESPLYAPETGAGATELPRVGTQEALRELHSLAFRTYLDARLPEILLDTVALVIGLFSLGLYFFRPRATEYLWCALWMFSADLYSLLHMWRGFLHWRIPPMALFFASILSFASICWLLFIWRFVGSGFDWRLRTGIAVNFMMPISIALVICGVFAIPATFVCSALTGLIMGALVLTYLLKRVIHGNRDAQVLLPPFLLYSGMNLIRDSRSALFFLSMVRTEEPMAYVGPAFAVTWEQIFDLVAYLAVAGALAMRFTRSAQEEQRLSTEMRSAHRVQSQLVPAILPSTPQFSFDAAYIAASEVGGDFYQVIPIPDGSLLVAVGDVSGKGLKAAMLGVLVVGALRSLAQEDLSPSEVLRRLNLLLNESADGGFVTCVLLRLSHNGDVKMANAGHLAPYLNGVPVEIEGSLPLGMVEQFECSVHHFSMAESDTLLLLSDGVAEATNKEGKLFGFERVLDLVRTQPTAAKIAQTAQAFGQEDDITVIAVTKMAVVEPAMV
jgi:hypothetical protein